MEKQDCVDTLETKYFIFLLIVLCYIVIKKQLFVTVRFINLDHSSDFSQLINDIMAHMNPTSSIQLTDMVCLPNMYSFKINLFFFIYVISRMNLLVM